MTKEKLKEEWGTYLRTVQTPNSFEDMAFDWFYSKLQEIRSEDMRVLEEKIEDIEIGYGEDSLLEFKASNRMRDTILDLIKQDNE